MAGDESGPSLYRVLADRCSSLEASYVKLKEVLCEMAEEKNRSDVDTASRRMIMMSDSDYVTSGFGSDLISGFFKEGTPYRKVLNSIGHAIVVCSAASGEITFWNRSAERLYGWKDYEVLGESVAELLVAEEYYEPYNTIIENLLFGQSWSGQFPFRRRSGEIFMALVTKGPMYTDGMLTGIITCSSDAEIFNTGHSEKQRVYQNRDRAYKNTIQWNSRPQIASSVSNLASKFKLRKHGDDVTDAHDISGDQEHTATKPGSLAAKMLAKFHIRGFGKRGKDHNAADQQNGPCGNPARNEAMNDNYRSSEPSMSNGYSVHGERRIETNFRRNSSVASQRVDLNVNASRSLSVSDESYQASPWGYKGSLQFANQTESFSRFVCIEEMDELESEAPNLDDPENENEAQRQQDGKRFSSSGESSGSSGSSTNRGDKESNALADCEIRWEDLQLGEDIGQGSFAVVYRGTWNGSDVAVKHYFASEFKEETLKDHKKEIGIMKRLRHPNVLLFMGAVFSPDRPAIVTEFMPRGSLFKTLHKNNQALDMKRRLRMALDVARGMNYLHHRNPPIVHRDLKSSNLLVDRNWTVKVGDFGLSRWKNATFLSARSANGTPQWMAPEVLRNEPSNEKSDVFSFGVILWELMTVSVPWANLNSLQVVGVVGFMDRRLEVPESVDPRIASMIRECWRSDPAQRPSFEDIIHRMTAIIQTSRS